MGMIFISLSRSGLAVFYYHLEWIFGSDVLPPNRKVGWCRVSWLQLVCVSGEKSIFFYFGLLYANLKINCMSRQLFFPFLTNWFIIILERASCPFRNNWECALSEINDLIQYFYKCVWFIILCDCIAIIRKFWIRWLSLNTNMLNWTLTRWLTFLSPAFTSKIYINGNSSQTLSQCFIL